MEREGVHIISVFDGILHSFPLTDEYGQINIFMLPFIRPSDVRRFFPEEEIDTFSDALKLVIDHADIDPAQRNIMISHQFVTGASRSESETISVGGTDNVDADVYRIFDYTALGHIHGPQDITSDGGYQIRNDS